MSTETKTLIIEADVSKALAAEDQLAAATARREAAARELADLQNRSEREHIEALKSSNDETKQAIGLRREQMAAARETVREATEAQRQARDAIKAEAQAQREVLALERERVAVAQRRADVLRREASELDHHAKLIRAYGADESAILRTQERALEQRARAERFIGNEVQARVVDMQRELHIMQRQAAEEKERAQADYERRNKGFGDATQAANQRGYDAPAEATAKTREWGDAVKGVRQNYLEVAASVGNVITGIQSAIALGREAVDFVDRTVNESFEVQSIARNLQLDISQARAALGGMVADKDLALAANKAVAMGVADTGAKFAHIAEMVAQQAVKLGKDQTQLINDYVEAVGKQEAEIFDNLGLTLRLTDAYDIYAEQLGKTAKELTKTEKAEAFNAAALAELERATGQAAVKVEGFAAAWKEGRVEWENFRTSVLGFDDTAGKVNEALRTMTDEEIERFRRLAEDTRYHAASLDDANELLAEYGITLGDVKRIADEQGLSYQQLLENAIEAHARLFQKKKEQIAEEQKLQTIQALNTEADDLEHAAKLLDVMGGKKKDVLAIEIQSLETQYNALMTQAKLTRSTEDELKARKLLQQIEIKQAQIEMVGVKKGGKRRDPNDAINRERDATLAVLDARAKVADAQQKQLRDADQVRTVELFLLDLERQKLDVRQQAEESRNPKKAADIAKRDAELQKIATERRLLDLQAEDAAQQEAQEAAERRIAMLDREIERNEALGVSVELLRKQRADAAQQAVDAYGTTEEIDQARHERELANIEEARARRVAVEQERLAGFEREVELANARGELVQREEERRLEFEMRVAAAEGDTERRRELQHKREVARVAERVRRQQAAVQATNGFLGQAQAFGQLIVDNAIKNDARREKAALRLNGVMAMARGAIETVEAVAAFARYDFVGGALHTAAAAVAFTQGAIMLAGQVPGGGGAAAPAGGSAGHQTVLADSSSSSGGGMRDRPSAPPSAEELTRLRGGYGARPSNEQQAAPQQVVHISHSTIVTADTGTALRDIGGRQNAKKYGT